MEKVTPKQILELINRLPDAESHIHICCIDGKHCVTNEWFAGNFAGRSFEADNYEDAAQQLIDYMYEHIGHNSMVGKSVSESGFPNLEKVYEYCKPKVLIEDEMQQSHITFCVYTRYALTKISNYKQMLVGVSCIYAVISRF